MYKLNKYQRGVLIPRNSSNNLPYVEDVDIPSMKVALKLSVPLNCNNSSEQISSCPKNCPQIVGNSSGPNKYRPNRIFSMSDPKRTNTSNGKPPL